MPTTTLQTNYTYYFQIVQINEAFDPTIPEDDPNYVPLRAVLEEGISTVEDAMKRHIELVPEPNCMNIIEVTYFPSNN